MKSDIEINREYKPKKIDEIAELLKIKEKYLIKYGDYIAKIKLDLLDEIEKNENGKYILITGITPTPLGEGKTTTTVGLGQAFAKLKKKGLISIRQPSLGPIFGIKGGAHGGGYSQVYPMDEFNLHFTGDNYAVYTAHNLLVSFLYNSIYHKNPLNIDLNSISIKRVMDISDRGLRKIIAGVFDNYLPHESGFEITSASEIMAILSLSRSLKELREKLGNIIVGFRYDKKPVFSNDLEVAGSLTALTKNALMPNLIQTIEGTPVFVHTGPFGNIAHGNSSIIADLIGIKISDYLITEAGFGTDLGAEKFFNIKCRYSKLKPDAAVIVVSLRSLKMHGGVGKISPGKPLPKEILEKNLDAIKVGSENLKKHIENIKIHGIKVIVNLNYFEGDDEDEINLLRKISLEYGSDDFVVSEVYSKGGEGGVDLAKSIMKLTEKKEDNFNFLYPLDMSIKDKIKTIATKIYGAKDVKFSNEAINKIELLESLGFSNLPICMAKTHLSLSHDSKLKGRPDNFILPIDNIKISNGAGFIVTYSGEISTMPSLPSNPIGKYIDIDNDGNIYGLK
ncbi:MAG: formate--tetrahydrofolate ligase [Caldisericia bacterium]|nr:formate--tetrahydrofolate ligase [Caldisericia bacterium]